MQPIILLGIAVAAIALVSTGFLQGEPWNEFVLFVQSLGWGESMLNSPISHAFVDLEVKKIQNDGPDGEPDTGDDFFDNVIHACSFHGDKDIPGIPPSTLQTIVTPINNGVIICKMLDENNNAFAEGKLAIPGGYGSSGTLFVPIVQCITDEGLVEEENCLDVQAPIHFVKLVVEAPLWQEQPRPLED